MEITQTTLLAETKFWNICVGRLRDSGRWVGFAIGDLEDGGRFVNLMPQAGCGIMMGLASRDEAIRQACACAQDFSQGYGTIETWHISEQLRSTADDYRCENCDQVCCDGLCEDFYEPEDIEDMGWGEVQPDNDMGEENHG